MGMPSGTMMDDPSAGAGGGASGGDASGAPRRPRVVEADLKHALGYLGAALLFVGLFLPLVDVPSLGSLNYFWNSGGGVLLLILVATSVAALVSQRFWALWLTGAAAGASVVVTLARAVVRAEPIEAASRQLPAAPSSLHGALSRGLESGLSEAVQLQWGWPVLVLGSLLLVASAEVARREGQRAPGFFRDLVMATALLIAMLVIGPPVLSHTQKVFVDFRAEEKQEERLRWVPHESARGKMAAVMAAQTREQELAKLALAEEARREQELARRRANDVHTRRVRLVNDVRRWYPQFAATVRPVVEARDAFLREYRADGLAGAGDACRSLVEALRGTAEAYPRSPDRKLHDAMTRLIELRVALDRLCPDASAPLPREELAGSAEEIEAVLDELRVELSGYCLELPGRQVARGPGTTSMTSASVDGVAPGDARAFDPRWMLALR
jgi:hypothetical protein